MEGIGRRERVRMLSSVKVTMIAFTAFVVETDDAATVRSVKQSILEYVRATRKGLRHFSDNDRTVWQNSFGTLDKDRRNHVVICAIGSVCCQRRQRFERGPYGILHLYILN